MEMLRLIKIAIVGADAKAWRKISDGERKVKDMVRQILCRYGDWSNIVLVSGHCPKGGVDIWMEEIAKELEIKTEIYAPEVNQWEDKIVKMSTQLKLQEPQSGIWVSKYLKVIVHATSK